MKLRWLIDTLEKHYGPAPRPFPTDPFELVLWENVAYLADDETRRAALESLRRGVGTRPAQILGATRAQLVEVTRGGILADVFSEKLRVAAEIAVGEFDGDLSDMIRGPVKVAKKALRRFPGIGEPGAEKILLFTRSHPFLAAESNALRVLERCGLCPAGKSYGATYAAVRELAQRELGDDFDALYTARHLLRRHGQELCRRRTPQCGSCLVRPKCPFPS